MIDECHSALDLLRDPCSAIQVAGEDGTAKTVRDRISDLQRLGFIFDDVDRKHRPERLLTIKRIALIDVGDHRRLQVKTRTVDALSPEDDRRAGRLCIFNQFYETDDCTLG